MTFPFNTNSIEQVEIDPQNLYEGIIWYNSVEKVYKTWANNTIQIFLTDSAFADNVVKSLLENTKFTLTFTDSNSLIVKHNKNTNFFTYQIFDSTLNETVHASIEIIDSNEIRIDFADILSGHLFMSFQ